jgi:SAM-dependent methyltransferase
MVAARSIRRLAAQVGQDVPGRRLVAALAGAGYHSAGMAILTAPWLRRVALPLRAANPNLYRELNRVRKRVLARGRDLDGYQSVAFDRFRKRVRLKGRSVLEIGTDPEMRLLRQFTKAGAERCCGLNNDPELFSGRGELSADGLRLLYGEAAALPFEDQSFDAIFSVATFEHILDLPQAVREMHRVLRPGGIVYSNFGPIWSSCKGHHVRARAGQERAWHADPKLNPLPDFCHLLMQPDDLRAALRGRVSAALEEPIVDWVYSSDGINRLFYSDYVREFESSPLRVESLLPERDPVSLQLLRILKFRYPEEEAFDITNVEAVLVRDP